MTKLVAGACVVAGLLLVVIPRFLFPPCEWIGLARMHCTDTARAEIVVGALLVAGGAAALAVRRRRPVLWIAVASVGLVSAAWFAPSVFGYCASPRMPCHYGMVPGVRFVAALAGAVLVAAAAALARDVARRPEAR